MSQYQEVVGKHFTDVDVSLAQPRSSMSVCNIGMISALRACSGTWCRIWKVCVTKTNREHPTHVVLQQRRVLQVCEASVWPKF